MKHAILPFLFTMLSILGLKQVDISTSPEITNTTDTVYVLENHEVLYSLPQSSPLPEFDVGGRKFGMQMHPIFKKMKMHGGIDIACPNGTEVYAQGNGRITNAGYVGGYGILVEVYHGVDNNDDKIKVRYAHLSKLNVSLGDFVEKGALLGWTGTTGTSTGPHLHYEYVVNDTRVDPLKYLCFDKKNVTRLRTESKPIQPLLEEQYESFHQLDTDDIVSDSKFLRAFDS